ncbi:glycosyltransferase family 2 protein [Polyangium spumosum]|uniref:Glycosyltransferase n=1 Tax=Polyangium spumosum TaxID=889282 RepID=A0A6N7PVG0_9BACT|nr:glycosyltransferase [Polyangium spumosum]MRG94235.1 glycosyltransferase [Polyangium spumosum]
MTTDIPDLLGLLLFGWSFAVASTSLEAVRRTTFAPRAARGEGAEQAVRKQNPSVLVVRPCAGNEPSLERTLASLARAKRSFDVRCRFAIEDESDLALPAATRAKEALARAGIEAEIVFTGGGGPNRKAAQLAAAAEGADVLIVTDSDVDLDGVDLDALVAPLVGPSPAWVAWAPPAEHAPPRTLGDHASAAVLGASLHAFPVLARLDPRGLVGKLFAIHASALAAIGGFGSLVDYLGEDMEIARRVRERGGSVVAVPIVARSLAEGRSWEAVIARFSRWLTVIRAQRPLLLWSYPALFFATWPIVLLAAAFAFVVPNVALAAALLALGARLVIALVAAWAAGRSVGLISAIRDAVLADVVLAFAFTRALRSRTVTWRDRVLVVDRTGLLRQPSAVKP